MNGVYTDCFKVQKKFTKQGFYANTEWTWLLIVLNIVIYHYIVYIDIIYIVYMLRQLTYEEELQQYETIMGELNMYIMNQR